MNLISRVNFRFREFLILAIDSHVQIQNLSLENVIDPVVYFNGTGNPTNFLIKFDNLIMKNIYFTNSFVLDIFVTPGNLISSSVRPKAFLFFNGNYEITFSNLTVEEIGFDYEDSIFFTFFTYLNLNGSILYEKQIIVSNLNSCNFNNFITFF